MQPEVGKWARERKKNLTIELIFDYNWRGGWWWGKGGQWRSSKKTWSKWNAKYFISINLRIFSHFRSKYFICINRNIFNSLSKKVARSLNYRWKQQKSPEGNIPQTVPNSQYCLINQPSTVYCDEHPHSLTKFNAPNVWALIRQDMENGNYNEI